MNNKFKRGSIFLLVLLIGLISIFAVDAARNSIIVSVYNVSGIINNAPGSTHREAYGAATFNMTNTSNNRPFIYFNVSNTGAALSGVGGGFNQSYNVTLTIYPQYGRLSAFDYVLGAGFPNVTTVDNNTVNIIYFNGTLGDGYYTWALNISNSSGAGSLQNVSTNITDFYALIIDTTAPNITLVTTTFPGSRTSAVPISINLTTNDTLNNALGGGLGYNSTIARVASGGFLSFYLRNQSGVLNWSIRPRNVFNESAARTNFTFYLPGVGMNLADGEYFFNASVNDSLGNIAWLGEKSLVIDRVSPVVTIDSSAGLTMNRLATTTLTCNVADMHPENVTMSVTASGGDSGTCTETLNISSCNFQFKPSVAETKTVTCTGIDRAGNSITSTKSLTVNQDNSGGGGSSGGSGGGGGGGESQSTTATVTANEPFTYSVNNPDIGVDSVTLTSSETADAKLTVSAMSDKPSGSPEPSVKVYKYFDVVKQNLADTALKEATITFSVSKEWLTQNNGNAADVVLQRLHNEVWESYSPTQSGETDTHYKFQATVPGFSSFVIGLKTGDGVTPAPSEEGTEADTTTEPAAEKTKVLPIVIVLVVLALVVGLVWYFVGRRKQ